MSHPRRIALLLAFVTLALYLPVAWFGFVVYDDGVYVVNNPAVKAGLCWLGIKWAFTSMAASNWHPLTWISLMADCSLFGAKPGALHLVNALFHSANAALLFILLLRLTQKAWPAAFIAALFAWHPMHVESVAWVAERKDVLSTFFALLTMLAYAKYVVLVQAKSGKWKLYYALSLLAFALGLLAKPMLVTLPCILLLLDFWPLRRIASFELRAPNLRIAASLVLEKLPFLALTVAESLVTMMAQSQKSADAVASLDLVSLHYRLKNVPVAYVEYLYKTFWPTKLAVFYPLPDTISPVHVSMAVMLLAGITIAAFWLYRTRPYWLTGWFWFLGMLVPVIGLVQVGGAQIADRYSYLSSVGIFIIVTFSALDVSSHLKMAARALAAVAVLILLGCVLLTEKQLWYWQNSETLFRHALAVTPDNDISRNDLGVALEQEGRLEEAAEQYRAAMRLEPDRYDGAYNLARVLDQQGHHQEALSLFRKAVQVAPDTQFLHYNLGLALIACGQTNEALKEFAASAKLDSQYPWPHMEMAKIYLDQGHDKEAVESLRAAVRSGPGNVGALILAARVLAASEDPAIRDGHNAFVLAAEANLLTGGRQPDVLDVLGMACAEMGKFDDAQMAAQEALKVAAALKEDKTGPIQERLKLYKNHQPWRESFRGTNSPAKN